MIEVLGAFWIRASEASEQFGSDVTSAMLRRWADRGVGPVDRRITVRRYRDSLGAVWYHHGDAIEAEHAARTAGSGRPRRASV